MRHEDWHNEENVTARAINPRLQVLKMDPPPQLTSKPLDDLEHLALAACATNVTKTKGSTGHRSIKSVPSTEAYFHYHYVRTNSHDSLGSRYLVTCEYKSYVRAAISESNTCCIRQLDCLSTKCNKEHSCMTLQFSQHCYG